MQYRAPSCSVSGRDVKHSRKVCTSKEAIGEGKVPIPYAKSPVQPASVNKVPCHVKTMVFMLH